MIRKKKQHTFVNKYLVNESLMLNAADWPVNMPMRDQFYWLSDEQG